MKTNPFDEENIKSKFSTQFAIASFSFGTILFITFMVFPEWEILLYIGFFNLLFLALFNSLILVNLVLLLTRNPQYKVEILSKILILLLNIPIALLYLDIVMHAYKNYNEI